MHRLHAPPPRIGPFVVERPIASGGMAETFVGVREGPGGFVQRVCLKRVLPVHRADEELRQLFHREARLAAGLSHRNITRVVDFGEDDGQPWLALELVEGLDLRRLCKRLPGRRLPVQLAVLVGLEVAEALEHAHARGLVHRDVAPGNVLVSTDGDVKLTDFGVSKAKTDPRLTRTGVVRGNAWYLAPERLERGAVATPRSDLWSLGVLLFECITGARPHPASTPASAMMAIAEDRRLPIRDVAPELSEPLTMVIERLLAFDPADRFADARDVVDALAPLTREAPARRALRGAVREMLHEDRPPPKREPVPDAEPTEPTAPSHVGPAPVRTRWRPYFVGPGIWADVAEAHRRRAARRTGDGGSLTRSRASGSAPALPSAWRSPAWVGALALVGTAMLLAIVLIAWLAA